MRWSNIFRKAIGFVISIEIKPYIWAKLTVMWLSRNKLDNHKYYRLSLLSEADPGFPKYPKLHEIENILNGVGCVRPGRDNPARDPPMVLICNSVNTVHEEHAILTDPKIVF